MKTNSRTNFIMIAIAVAFVLYTAFLAIISVVLSAEVVSAIVSWVFMTLGFGMFLLCLNLGKTNEGLNYGMFLGLTVYKHCTVYLVIDFVLSVVFLVLSAFTPISWLIGLLVQFVVFAIYAVIVTLCVITKNEIESVGTKTAARTANMKLLKADAMVLVDYCKDSEVKAEVAKFVEAVKYSDPTSFDAISYIEQQLMELVYQMKQALIADNIEAAKSYCAQATALLNERNIKCKILKPKH